VDLRLSTFRNQFWGQSAHLLGALIVIATFTLAYSQNASAISGPTVTSTASAPVIVGSPISDEATLTGGVDPTGTMTFTVFGPNDPTCSNAPVFSSSTNVNGDGDYSSASFTTSAAGTYTFVASYGGDANNDAFTSTCGSDNENVVVSQATPSLVTIASGSVPTNTAFTDHATLSGGFNPTGILTFILYGPNDPTCSNSADSFAETEVLGDGTYVPTLVGLGIEPGVYQYTVTYSGDANNEPITIPCGSLNQSVVVTPAFMTASAPVSVVALASNVPVSTVATLWGTSNQTGTITYDLYGPDNPTCTGEPIFTGNSVVRPGTYVYSPNGTFVSTPGTYNWVVTYSGDANNAALSVLCGAANQSVTVTKADTDFQGHASAPVTVGDSVSDSARLVFGTSPTGTITYDLYGPDNTTCTGTPVFTSTTSVNGINTYDSGTFAPSVAGTYTWVASYSGDSNNLAAETACDDPNQSVMVATVPLVWAANGVVASPGVDSATVTWSTPTGVEADGVSAYTVTSYPSESTDAPTVTTSGLQTAVTIGGLAPGVEYQFTVTAIGASGTGPISEVSNTVVPTSLGTVGEVSGSSSGHPPSATATSGTLSATAEGSGTISVARYSGNPVGGALAGATSFFDVSIGPGSSFTSVTFKDCDLAGGTTIDWWAPNSQTFQALGNETGPTGSPACITVTINGQSYSPYLFQLSGTVFATVSAPSTPVGSGGSAAAPSATIPVNPTSPAVALASSTAPTAQLALTGFAFLPLLFGGGGLVVGGSLLMGYRRRVLPDRRTGTVEAQSP
jgi:hypothetical protein